MPLPVLLESDLLRLRLAAGLSLMIDGSNRRLMTLSIKIAVLSITSLISSLWLYALNVIALAYGYQGMTQIVCIAWWQTDTMISCICLVLFGKSAETVYNRLCCICAQICNNCMKRALLKPQDLNEEEQELSGTYFGIPSGASNAENIESDPTSVNNESEQIL